MGGVVEEGEAVADELGDGVGHFQGCAEGSPLPAVGAVVEGGRVPQVGEVAFGFQVNDVPVVGQGGQGFRPTAFGADHHHLFLLSFHPDAYLSVALLEERQSGKVAFRHVRDVQGDDAFTRRAEGALGQGVPGLQEVRLHAPRLQAQESLPLPHGPQGIVRLVVPLPYEGQVGVAAFPVEIVGVHDAAHQSRTCRQGQRVGHPSVGSDGRPSVFPLYGCQIGDASHRTVVAEKVGKPPAVGRIDEAALCDAPVAKHHLPLPRPGERAGAVDDHRAHALGRPGDVEQVVHPVLLEQLRALGRKPPTARRGAGILDKYPLRPFFHAGEVVFQFRNGEAAAAPYDVAASVIVEE